MTRFTETGNPIERDISLAIVHCGLIFVELAVKSLTFLIAQVNYTTLFCKANRGHDYSVLGLCFSWPLDEYILRSECV